MLNSRFAFGSRSRSTRQRIAVVLYWVICHRHITRRAPRYNKGFLWVLSSLIPFFVWTDINKLVKPHPLFVTIVIHTALRASLKKGGWELTRPVTANNYARQSAITSRVSCINISSCKFCQLPAPVYYNIYFLYSCWQLSLCGLRCKSI